ncbi:hypothetical protein F3H15_34590 [Pseudomonas aeruginosa]|nr:hypothetical protein F3H15_34590 [Pseudomonas aeruginosa]
MPTFQNEIIYFHRRIIMPLSLVTVVVIIMDWIGKPPRFPPSRSWTYAGEIGSVDV